MYYATIIIAIAAHVFVRIMRWRLIPVPRHTLFKVFPSLLRNAKRSYFEGRVQYFDCGRL